MGRYSKLDIATKLRSILAGSGREGPPDRTTRFRSGRSWSGVVVVLWRTESSEAGFSRVLDQFGSRVAIELALNVRAVRFGCAQADIAQSGDVDVRVTEHEQQEHVLLPGRECERLSRSLRQRELHTQRGLQVGLAVGDGAYRGQQVCRFRGFEQVAVGTSGKNSLDLGGIADGREHQNGTLLEEFTEPDNHVAVFRIGQVDIGYNNVGCDIEASGVAHGRRLGDDDKIGLLLDHRAQALSHHRAAFDENYVDGATGQNG